MAFLRVNFYSDVLAQATEMNVILPEGIQSCTSMESNGIQGDFPVLYLLHGYNGDESVWFRYSAIERYAGKYPLAIVMPRGNHGFYANSPETSYAYYTFITEELPKKVQHFFPISKRREDTFIAGLSMGGYGTLRAALGRCDLYAAAASLSGFVDPSFAYDAAMMRDHSLRSLGADANIAQERDNDLIPLLEKRVAQGAKLPKLYLTCGTEDRLYQQNLNFKAACERLGVDLGFDEQHGVHDWIYWDRTIQDVLAFLPIAKRE